MATKKTTKPALKKVATIERPNHLGRVVAANGQHTLYLLETKVSDDYLPSFPDATVARITAWDLAAPSTPVRQGSCDVRAAWAFVATPTALYVLVARTVAPQNLVMDLAVIDITDRLAPRLATTLENVGAFVRDSKDPVLVVSGKHLLLSTRAEPTLEVFDLTTPLAPTRAGTVALPHKPQTAFGDDAGVVVTFLGKSEPMLALTYADATWNARPMVGLGSQKPGRIGETFFCATGDFNNCLSVFDSTGTRRSETKLGPTSIVVEIDGDRVVTCGDALSVWTQEGELIAKKNGVDCRYLTASAGFIAAPQPPNPNALDKRKAFAFDLWQLS